MAPSETAESRADTQGMAAAENKGTVRTGNKEYSDAPLNYRDRERSINKQLRRLDLKWLLEAVRESVGLISSAMLVGGAATLIYRRRYILGGNLALAFLAQQYFMWQRRKGSPALPKGRTPKEEIELERFALKAERGDFGKIDFIAFK
jgi:hypothetical protein